MELAACIHHLVRNEIIRVIIKLLFCNYIIPFSFRLYRMKV